MAMTKTGAPLDLSAPTADDTPGWVTDFAGNARKINDFARATSDKIGDITTLRTVCKDNLVGAVNEVINTIPDLGGTNILNATNEQIVLGTTAQWSKRTWRSTRSPQSGVDPEGTSTAISIDDSPNPHIKHGFELNTVTGSIMVAQDAVPFNIGKIYTLSCYARATNGTGKLLLQVGAGATWLSVIKDVTDSWQKYYMTFSAKKEYCNAYFGNVGEESAIQVCGCKLEVGDCATDWSYSPNDIDARNAQKLDKSKVVNGLLTTEEGFALDARQGKALDEKIAELNSKLLYDEAAFGDLIDTYLRVGLFSGFRLFKVGRIAHLQFGFYNKVALSAGHFFVKLPQAYRPISTIQLFDLSDDIKYRLDTDGVMYATKSIDVNTATRIITTYYCAE